MDHSPSWALVAISIELSWAKASYFLCHWIKSILGMQIVNFVAYTLELFEAKTNGLYCHYNKSIQDTLELPSILIMHVSRSSAFFCFAFLLLCDLLCLCRNHQLDLGSFFGVNFDFFQSFGKHYTLHFQFRLQLNEGLLELLHLFARSL